jgi:thioesterase domain-containing protein/acyl carrier protein
MEHTNMTTVNRRTASTKKPLDDLGFDLDDPELPDLLEEQLAAIWREILEVPSVSPVDDFFELGGTSLHSAVIVARIKKTFGCVIGLNTFFDASTVNKQAVLLRKDSRTRVPSVIAWREGGSRSPLFCLPGGAGHVLALRDLLLQLPSEQPVYGFEGKSIIADDQSGAGEGAADGDAPVQARIEKIAAAHLEDVVKIQPHGPYYLTGLCFGGLVVFEMARQLIAGGEQVAFVGLLDPPVPGLTYATLTLSALRASFGRLMKKSWPQRIEVSKKTASVLWQNVTARWQRFLLRLFAGRQVGAKLDRKALIYQAVLCYRPGPYRGILTIFLPEENSLLRNQHAEAQWRKLVGGLEVRSVPGDHGIFFREPQASTLSQRMMECIDAARQSCEQAGQSKLRLAGD